MAVHLAERFPWNEADGSELEDAPAIPASGSRWAALIAHVAERRAVVLVEGVSDQLALEADGRCGP